MKTNKRSLRTLTLLLLILSGCRKDPSVSEIAKYEEAKKSKSIIAYEDYLKEYPDGSFASEAKQTVENLLKSEIYELVTPDEYILTLTGVACSTGDGVITSGSFTKLFCEGEELAVQKNEIERNGFISTKDYGQFQISLVDRRIQKVSFYLNPSQKKQLMKFRQEQSAESVSKGEQSLSASIIKRDLATQLVYFKKGFFLFRPGDCMKVGAVRDSNTVSTAIVRSIIFVNITFEFRGGTIGGKDVWLKAGGNMEYSLRDGVCRFVNFCGFYPAEM